MSENEGKGKMKNAPGKKRPGFFSKNIEFSLRSPEAREVFVAGDFNGWDTGTVPLKKGEGGVWKTKLKLPSGRYEYKFFKDGSWVQDVAGTESVPNIFGTRNLVVEVR
jgi:1,4-alpha-glucan branching enzyme